MEKVIRVSIRRERTVTREAPRVQVYEVEANGEMTILEILGKIYEQVDATVAYRRYRCGRRICRSCEVKLDGRVVRGCATLLRPGESYLLEPARPSSLIRDLVFEFDQ